MRKPRVVKHGTTFYYVRIDRERLSATASVTYNFRLSKLFYNNPVIKSNRWIKLANTLVRTKIYAFNELKNHSDNNNNNRYMMKYIKNKLYVICEINIICNTVFNFSRSLKTNIFKV